MFRLNFKKMSLSQRNAALLFAIMIFFIHNFYFLLNRFFRLIGGGLNDMGYVEFLFESTLHFFLIFSLLFCCSFNKIIFRVAVVFLLCASTIFAFIYNKFGVVIDQTSITNAFDNLANVNDLLNFRSLALYLIFLLLLPLLLLLRIELVVRNNRVIFSIMIVVAVFFVVSLSVLDKSARKTAIIAYSPISLIDSTIEYFTSIRQSLQNKKHLQPIGDIVYDIRNNHRKASNLKVVFILGESARAQNFSINGYARETNPLLQKQSNLLSFKDVTPCHNLTSYSVSCLLSHKKSAQFSLIDDNDESLIKLFEKLNFTTAWYSTQKAVGDDNILLTLGMQAQKYMFGNNIAKHTGGGKIYDEYLLDFFAKEIANDGDNFVILHTQGSHFIFDDRYPDEFRKFLPVCDNRSPQECNTRHLVNAYDNSILYTDYFIAQVIELLKKQNAILFYVSDHGQFLGEGDIYYHGNSGEVQYKQHKVPMFLWMSDSLLKNKFYQKKFKTAAAHIDDAISHDNIFDSILDCSGVESKFFDRGLSLCKPLLTKN